MRILSVVCAAALLIASGAAAAADKILVRIGHFPNITHVQGLVAHAMSRRGDGWFEKRLGSGIEVQWFVYNAGPSAMEAIFAQSLDVTYVGPSPALNAHIRSNGTEIRILAGAVNGGAALVVQGDGRIRKPEDFRGKKIATPQLGNTQDVECRAWLKRQGLKITMSGGDAFVLPTANPDQLALFLQGRIDAVWTVEPWVSRLELEAKGVVFLEQKETVTTVLASSVGFLKRRGELARRLVEAHNELSEWIEANPAAAKELARSELTELTRREMPALLVEKSWARMQITTAVDKKSLDQFVADAVDAGFLRAKVDLARLLEPGK
jgi:NitT/TauT family transport system substrate-binding protein